MRWPADVNQIGFYPLWCRSLPLGGVFARPWSRSWSQRREPHKTTRQYLPLRRWWTAWPSSPSRLPASPLCSSVWLKYPREILPRSRDPGLFTLHAVLSFLFEMPYFAIWLVSLKWDEVKHRQTLTRTSVRLLLSWVPTVGSAPLTLTPTPPECWFAFVC